MTVSARNVADLNAVVARARGVKFLFFWGHQSEPDGRVSGRRSDRPGKRQDDQASASR